jgi:hypothetical protein
MRYKKEAKTQMINEIIKIFCDINDFCKVLERHIKDILISEGDESGNKYFRLCSSKNLSICEIMTIIIYFHLSNLRVKSSFHNITVQNG